MRGLIRIFFIMGAVCARALCRYRKGCCEDCSNNNNNNRKAISSAKLYKHFKEDNIECLIIHVANHRRSHQQTAHLKAELAPYICSASDGRASATSSGAASAPARGLRNAGNGRHLGGFQRLRISSQPVTLFFQLFCRHRDTSYIKSITNAAAANNTPAPSTVMALLPSLLPVCAAEAPAPVPTVFDAD